MFEKCPLCGKKFFALFKKVTKCPQCGNDLTTTSEKSVKPAEAVTHPPKRGLVFPERIKQSLEDGLKRQMQRNFEMGNFGTVNILNTWGDILKNRPFDIPFYTALKDRACIAIYFSSGTLSGEKVILDVLNSRRPLAIQVKAFLEAKYPLVRNNLIFPDNPRDPLYLETPMNVRDGDFQDFCQAILKEEIFDLIIKYEGSKKDEIYCAAYKATGLADVLKKEIARAVKALSPGADESDFQAAVRTMERVFVSANSGVDKAACKKLTFSGEAKNRLIEFSSKKEKKPEKKADLSESFSKYMKGHGEILIKQQAADPAMCQTIRDALKQDALHEAALMASEAFKEATKQGPDGPGITRQKQAGNFLLLVSVFPTDHIPTAAKSFSKGYLNWLFERFQQADQMPTKPAVAHWLFIRQGDEKIATHLTITHKDKTKNKVLAWDFLNPHEFKALGFSSDPRPPEVKKQWGL